MSIKWKVTNMFSWETMLTKVSILLKLYV